MRRFLTALILLLFTAALVTPAIAGTTIFDKIKTEKKLVVGLNASYPPFAFWTDQGPKGFDVEFARNLAVTMGLDPDTGLEFVPVKPDEAAGALVSGKIDVAIAALSVTPKRLARVAFSKPYVTISKAAIVQRSKIPYVIIGESLQPLPVYSYNDLHKLEPLRIGVKAGTTIYRATKKEFDDSIVIGYATTDEIKEAFFNDKIDAIVHEDPYVRAFQARYNKKRGQFLTLTKPVSKESLAVAYPYGNEDFARFLDGYILYLQESGTIEKWKKQYFDDAAWMGGAK